MCLAIPGKVKKIDGHKVLVEYATVNEERQALVGDDVLNIGDFVMVQMGIIVKVLSKKEAEMALMAWN